MALNDSQLDPAPPHLRSLHEPGSGPGSVSGSGSKDGGNSKGKEREKLTRSVADTSFHGSFSGRGDEDENGSPDEDQKGMDVDSKSEQSTSAAAAAGSGTIHYLNSQRELQIRIATATATGASTHITLAGLNTSSLSTSLLFSLLPSIGVNAFPISASNHLTLFFNEFLFSASHRIFVGAYKFKEIRHKEKCVRSALEQLKALVLRLARNGTN